MNITSITLPPIIKNLAWLFASLLVSLSASIAIMFYFNDSVPYLLASSVPDTPTAYLLGGFDGTALGILFNLSAFFYFTAFTFALKKRFLFSLLSIVKTKI